jgi:hypothetical protein
LHQKKSIVSTVKTSARTQARRFHKGAQGKRSVKIDVLTGPQPLFFLEPFANQAVGFAFERILEIKNPSRMEMSQRGFKEFLDGNACFGTCVD